MKMASFATPAFLTAWAKIYTPGVDRLPSFVYKAHILHEYLASQNKRFVELRESIITKYADKGEDGKPAVKDGNVHFADEVLEAVNKEFAELMALNLQPEVPLKLSLQELEMNGVKIAAPDVAVLSDILILEQIV